MVKVENYPNAYKEVYEILKNVSREEQSKIPKKFMEMIQKNMNKEYKFQLDKNIELEYQEIMLETKTVLAYIFLNYWSTEKQKEVINQKFKKDIEETENKKRQLYNIDIFTNKRQAEENIKEKLEMVIYKKESFTLKIFNKIRRFLGMKF